MMTINEIIRDGNELQSHISGIMRPKTIMMTIDKRTQIDKNRGRRSENGLRIVQNQ